MLWTATLEEIANKRTKRVHIHEKRIVATNAIEPDELRVIAYLGQTVGEILLLLYRKQEIRLHADDKSTLQFRFFES